jgi:hypothetical protein
MNQNVHPETAALHPMYHLPVDDVVAQILLRGSSG